MVGGRRAGPGSERRSGLGQSAAQIVGGVIGLRLGGAQRRIHQGRAEEDIIQLAAGSNPGNGGRGVLPIGGHACEAEAGIRVAVGGELGIGNGKHDVGTQHIVVGRPGGLVGELCGLAVADVLVHVADEQILVVVGVGSEIGVDVLHGAMGFNSPPELVDAGVAGLVVHGPEH